MRVPPAQSPFPSPRQLPARSDCSRAVADVQVSAKMMGGDSEKPPSSAPTESAPLLAQSNGGGPEDDKDK
eukprot:363174-Chlamydomonas_euryale.AAC.5